MFVHKLIFFGIVLLFLTISSGGKLKTNLLPGRNVCGKNRQEIILDGVKTEVGDFPWIALVESKKKRIHLWRIFN
ncbi:hypothetical protein ILUMI_24173 [Ignelater luminosus]|uniref:Uncharacterized protein n=1 Tax=Ignelater luminosus TaxID=2038154 RepID=A0A8K0CD32_IGNLU|nr:hypothetical protein ILUMI_24173 [Ignelater luminosus]